MTAVRTWCRQNRSPHQNPTGAVPGTAPGSPDRVAPRPAAPEKAALPASATQRAGPAPPGCHSLRCTGRGRRKARSHRAAAALGAARPPAHLPAARPPAHLSAAPPAAPALHPPPPAPRPFRRRTKAPTAGRRLPTADAEGQTSSEGVAECAEIYGNCGRTLRSAVKHPMPHSSAPSGPAIGKELTQRTSAKRRRNRAVPKARRPTPLAGRWLAKSLREPRHPECRAHRWNALVADAPRAWPRRCRALHDGNCSLPEWGHASTLHSAPAGRGERAPPPAVECVRACAPCPDSLGAGARREPPSGTAWQRPRQGEAGRGGIPVRDSALASALASGQ